MPTPAKVMNHKTRDPFFDLLKTWAIFLVVVQHMIAVCGIGLDMMNHPIGKAICMFNMPLFMFVTGYFSTGALSRPFGEFFRNKWDTWLRPALIFSIFLIGMRLFCGVISVPVTIKQLIVLLSFSFLCSYWFIPVAFLCCLIAKISYKISTGVYMLIGSWLLLVFFPVANWWPILAYLKAMYPFFVIGLLVRRYNLIESIKTYPLATGVPSLICFIAVWFWYDRDKFFYSFTIDTAGEMAVAYIAMLVAGCAGIVLSILLIRYLSTFDFIAKKWLVHVGSYTFIIYMLQQIAVQILDLQNLNILNFGIIFLISITVFAICVLLAELFDKNRFTRKYLLGKG